MDWITQNKLPLGQWLSAAVELLIDHAAVVFDMFALGLEWIILGVVAGLVWVPAPIFIGGVALFAYWLHRSIGLGVFAVCALMLILNLGYWHPMIETLVLVLISSFLCILIGIPIGIYAAHSPRFYILMRPLLDLMQTIPTFVYLIPTLILFGLGVVPGVISTVIFAIAAPIRLTALGIGAVPQELLEAGKAFGASRWKLLIKVELPAAMPTIMAGITQCIMLSLSMVVIAALVGADGLGKPVVRALNTVNIAQGFEAGLAIVLVAILLDRLCKSPASKGEKK